jgi:hypothetical protein
MVPLVLAVMPWRLQLTDVTSNQAIARNKRSFHYLEDGVCCELELAEPPRFIRLSIRKADPP